MRRTYRMKGYQIVALIHVSMIAVLIALWLLGR